MNWKTARRASEIFKALPSDTKLCPFCYFILQEEKEGWWYCPNEMCLYDEKEKEGGKLWV